MRTKIGTLLLTCWLGLAASQSRAEQFLYHGTYYTLQSDHAEFQSEDVIVIQTDRGPLKLQWSSLSLSLQRRFADARKSYIDHVEAQKKAAMEKKQDEPDLRNYVRGVVLSVVDNQTVLVIKRNDQIVLLRGISDKVDGESIYVRAVPDGTHRYTTVLGAEKTVRAYRVVEQME